MTLQRAPDISNIILLSVDCLRADISRELETLSGLMSSYIDAPDCQCTGSNTYTSMPGLMQSRLSTDAGGRLGPHPLVEGVPTLAEVLSEQGFHCAGWHSNHFTSREFAYQRGFEIFSDLTYDSPSRSVEDSDSSSELDLSRSLISRGRALSKQLGVEAQAKRILEWFQKYGVFDQPSVPAESVIDAILDRISAANGDSSLFLWGHLMDTHSPYSPPKQYREMISEGDVQTLNDKIRRQPQEVTSSEAELLKNLYLGSARYVDDQIARLIIETKSRGIWDETLLIITSDHGEMFSERSIPDYYPFEHPSFLCDYITHVPLVFAGGSLTNGTITETVSGMDIAPTIATIVGAEIPNKWRGIPIKSSKHDKRELVYSVTSPGPRPTQKNEDAPDSAIHASIRTERRAVLWWSNEDRSSELYDRSDTHVDPTVHERFLEADNSYNDLIASRFSGDGDSRKDVTDYAEGLDEETADRLRKLGYIE